MQETTQFGFIQSNFPSSWKPHRWYRLRKVSLQNAYLKSVMVTARDTYKVRVKNYSKTCSFKLKFKYSEGCKIVRGAVRSLPWLFIKLKLPTVRQIRAEFFGESLAKVFHRDFLLLRRNFFVLFLFGFCLQGFQIIDT